MDRHSRGGGHPRRRRLGVPAYCHRRDCRGHRGRAGAHKPCRYGGPHLTGMARRRANSGRSRVGPQTMTDDPIPWTLAEPEAMVIVRRIKARRHRHLFVPRLSEDGERWHAAWTVDAEGEAVPPPLEMPPPTWVSFCACGAEYNQIGRAH